MSAGQLLLETLRWSLGLVLLWRVPPLPRMAGGVGRQCSVIVPARNEAPNLARLLPSIVPQAAEVVVVDDSSTDATPEVARTAGARVVHPGEPPKGWLGKPWACAAGAAAARFDVLVFVDADVVVEPGGLARLLAALDAEGGLVSVQPWHDMRRPYERLSSIATLVSVMGVGAFSAAGRRLRPRGAFGPCIALDRRSYGEIGGHAAVRSEIAEDVALGRRSRKVTLYGGRGAFRYRMYPDGVRSLWEGWTKNLAAGAGAASPAIVGLVVVWMSGLLAAPFTHPALAALYAAQLWWLQRPLGRFGPLAAVSYPVPAAFFVGAFVVSLLRLASGRPSTWRGRRIPARQA